VTSYDYDAPINEQGQPTPKYFMLRRLIGQYADYKIPEAPQPVKTIAIPAISLQSWTNIWENLPSPVYSSQPLPMEMLDQNQGLVLYRTKLIGHKSGTLKIWEPHDYALVFLNGKFIDTVYRDGGKWEVQLPPTDVKDPVLDILVEGMGHINFAQFMIDRKGITDRVTLNGMTLMNWDMYKLPLDEKFIRQLKATNREKMDNGNGKFFKGTFTLTETGDTYLDLSRYSKGVVYVNGHNLGRYWSIGPQQRLFCPASWLKKGANEIVVFDLHQSAPETISGNVSLD
ncbi:MAG TPA: beta-galactosidase, partial [Flavisolibacter sp.]|nr:beta-galactosidase [Flavisolibacter sp.]